MADNGYFGKARCSLHPCLLALIIIAYGKYFQKNLVLNYLLFKISRKKVLQISLIVTNIFTYYKAILAVKLLSNMEKMGDK